MERQAPSHHAKTKKKSNRHLRKAPNKKHTKTKQTSQKEELRKKQGRTQKKVSKKEKILHPWNKNNRVSGGPCWCSGQDFMFPMRRAWIQFLEGSGGGETKIPHASMPKDFFYDLQSKKMPQAVKYMRKKHHLFTFQKMEQKEKAIEDVKVRKFGDSGLRHARKCEPRKQIGGNHSKINTESELKDRTVRKDMPKHIILKFHIIRNF